MQKLSLCLTIGLLFFIYSCKKSNSSSNSSNANSWLSSVTDYSPQQSIVDSFSYDSSHRIASFMQFEFDSTGGYPIYGNWSAIFALPAGSSAAPTSYTNDLTGTLETHELSYDAQGRITRDSSLGSSGWVIYFGYPNGNIAINAYYDGTIANSILDTLFMSNGNIASVHAYGPNNAGTADSLEGSVKYGFSGISNPGYHSTLTSTIGPLIYILQISGYGGFFDNISEKVLNSISGPVGGSSIDVTIPYTLTTDSQGRLSRQTASYGGSTASIVYRYY
jgi:YD repeat-containing protein